MSGGPTAAWYRDADHHRRVVEAVFVPSWQVGPDVAAVAHAAVPWRLGPGSLDEPVITLRGADGWLRTVSNVCTHRAARLLDAPVQVGKLRCPYHGRRFSLDGRCEASPGFDVVGREDDLPSLPTATLGPVVLASLVAGPTPRVAVGRAWARVEALLDRPMEAAPGADAAWELPVSWLSYVENYLEGLHVPFVHPSLARAVDVSSYAVEVLPRAVLQVAEASSEDDAFDLPIGHPDEGRRIAAYYLWLFPDLMLNLYPWGLSLNHVQPLGPDRVRVVYRTFVADPALRGHGAGGDVGAVEAEDQAILRRLEPTARLYRGARLAPGHEDGVAALWRWVAEATGESERNG